MLAERERNILTYPAKYGNASFRFTCNQHLNVSDVKQEDIHAIDAILQQFGILQPIEQRYRCVEMQ